MKQSNKKGFSLAFELKLGLLIVHHNRTIKTFLNTAKSYWDRYRISIPNMFH
jgi:hypothetical protein